MKNILIITTSHFFGNKGSALRIRKIAEILSQKYKVDLISYPEKNAFVNKNINVYPINNSLNLKTEVSKISFSKIYFDCGIFLKTIKLLKQKKYEIVHCEDFEAAFIYSIIKPFFNKKTSIYDLHNFLSHNLKINSYPNFLISFAKFLEKTIINNFDGIISNWKLYQKTEIIKKKKSFLFRDTIDVCEKKTKLPSKRIYLTYSGNYQKYQGVEKFIETFLKKDYNFDLVLIGKINQEIAEMIKNKKNIFCVGKLDIYESNYILKKATACISPRIFGRQPGMKTVHHLLLEKVTIASDCKANKEVLNKDNAIFYKNEKELEQILGFINENIIDFKSMELKIKKQREIFDKVNSDTNFLKNYANLLKI